MTEATCPAEGREAVARAWELVTMPVNWEGLSMSMGWVLALTNEAGLNGRQRGSLGEWFLRHIWQ